MVCKYFLPFRMLPFHSVACFLCCAEAFEFDVVPLTYFCFCCLCFWCYIQKFLTKIHMLFSELPIQVSCLCFHYVGFPLVFRSSLYILDRSLLLVTCVVNIFCLLMACPFKLVLKNANCKEEDWINWTIIKLTTSLQKMPFSRMLNRRVMFLIQGSKMYHVNSSLFWKYPFSD